MTDRKSRSPGAGRGSFVCAGGANDPLRCSITIIGMTRDVLLGYSPNSGSWATWSFQRRSRSGPLASTVARTGISSLSTSIVASGWAFRLWYHCGCSSAPPFDAAITQWLPSL